MTEAHKLVDQIRKVMEKYENYPDDISDILGAVTELIMEKCPDDVIHLILSGPFECEGGLMQTYVTFCGRTIFTAEGDNCPILVRQSTSREEITCHQCGTVEGYGMHEEPSEKGDPDDYSG